MSDEPKQHDDEPCEPEEDGNTIEVSLIAETEEEPTSSSIDQDTSGAKEKSPRQKRNTPLRQVLVVWHW